MAKDVHTGRRTAGARVPFEARLVVAAGFTWEITTTQSPVFVGWCSPAFDSEGTLEAHVYGTDVREFLKDVAYTLFDNDHIKRFNEQQVANAMMVRVIVLVASAHTKRTEKK